MKVKKGVLTMVAMLACVTTCVPMLSSCEVLLPLLEGLTSGLTQSDSNSSEPMQSESDSSEQPQVRTEVTAEEWKQIMGNCSNYTFKQTWSDGDDKFEAIMKLTDEGLAAITYRNGSLFGNNIYAKENDEHFSYNLDTSNGKWTKSFVFEAEYNNAMESLTEIQENFLFKDDYASFSYANGKYFAASLEKTILGKVGIFSNVEVVFNNGELVSTKFSLYADGIHGTREIFDVGTTVITFPTEYETKYP